MKKSIVVGGVGVVVIAGAIATTMMVKDDETRSAIETYNLGYKYDVGEGVEENKAEALRLYLEAANEGVANAQCNLGRMYYLGEGVEANYGEALKWYQKAAAQGLAEAQFSIGLIYEYGKGVPKDKAEAAKWYKKAAEQGYEDAQASLKRLNAQ